MIKQIVFKDQEGVFFKTERCCGNYYAGRQKDIRHSHRLRRQHTCALRFAQGLTTLRTLILLLSSGLLSVNMRIASAT